jgi:hypothetical protein
VNPDRIYSQYRDEALAEQSTAIEYSTFVAMPFWNRFSYRSVEIHTQVIQVAATRANELNQTARRFATPKRADDGSGTAVVITESIVTDILFSHLFIGDLTFANSGVLLEVGIAMGLKPNSQIILITQGDLRDLHFDIRNNNILSYNPKDAITHIAQAMIAAAKAFEADAHRIIESIVKTLTPDAVITLKLYGALQRGNAAHSIHAGVAPMAFSNDSRAEDRLEQASRELLQKRLIHTEYKVNAVPGGDMFGMHATKLGWLVIGRMWPEYAKRTAG